MTKVSYYFSHYANAHHYEKILELRAELGWEGYGIFWAMSEYKRPQTLRNIDWQAIFERL